MNRKYKEYLALQLGEGKAKSASAFEDYNYIAEACGAAKKLKENYDIGIALATDGLFMGYIARQFGFPVLDVKLGRRGNGATWNPMEPISKKRIKDKKVIVFDNDALTGRTLRRAATEIGAYSPQAIDLLLTYEETPIYTEKYIGGKIPRGLPSPAEITQKNWAKHGLDRIVEGWESVEKGIPRGWLSGEKGININYRQSDVYSTSLFIPYTKILTLWNTRINVPSTYRKVQTLQKNFKPDYEAMKFFKRKIMEK